MKQCRALPFFLQSCTGGLRLRVGSVTVFLGVLQRSYGTSTRPLEVCIKPLSGLIRAPRVGFRGWGHLACRVLSNGVRVGP